VIGEEELEEGNNFELLDWISNNKQRLLISKFENIRHWF
jgi:hypothetical protein